MTDAKNDMPSTGDGAAEAVSPTAADRRRHNAGLLGWVLALNAGLMVAEVIGGIVFGSLALLADAVHMVSDVTGLVIALVAQRIMGRASSPRHSYGLQRTEVLAAQINAVILLSAAVWVVIEAIRRIGSPSTIEAPAVLAIAAVGLAANVVSVAILARARRESLNMRAAFLHMAADAGGSVGVIIAGVAALGSVYWVDPVVALLLGGLIAVSGVRLLGESTHILLEGTPRNIIPEEITTVIAAIDGVDSIHHLHVWHLASDTVALSAHVVATGQPSLEEAQTIGNRIRAQMAEQFGISHTTLELENDPCE